MVIIVLETAFAAAGAKSVDSADPDGLARGRGRGRGLADADIMREISKRSVPQI